MKSKLHKKVKGQCMRLKYMLNKNGSCKNTPRLNYSKLKQYMFSHMIECARVVALNLYQSLGWEVGWLGKRGIKRGIGRTNEGKTEGVGGREGRNSDASQLPERERVSEREREKERETELSYTIRFWSGSPLTHRQTPTQFTHTHTRTHPHTHTDTSVWKSIFLLSTLECSFFFCLCLHSLVVSRWWWCVCVLELCYSVPAIRAA